MSDDVRPVTSDNDNSREQRKRRIEQVFDGIFADRNKKRSHQERVVLTKDKDARARERVRKKHVDTA